MTGSLAAVVYAHQGGWDEILMVAGPILVVVGLLRLAERRARRAREATDHSEDPVS
jgi:hypothetical protein